MFHFADTKWVAPFGDLRIEDCLRLPVTFRRLLRPSSLSDATGIPRMLLIYLFFHFIAALYLLVNLFRVINYQMRHKHFHFA